MYHNYHHISGAYFNCSETHALETANLVKSCRQRLYIEREQWTHPFIFDYLTAWILCTKTDVDFRILCTVFDLIPSHLGYQGYCPVIVRVSVNWGHKFHGSKVLQVWLFQWRLLNLRSIVFELSIAQTSTSEITLASVVILFTLSINWITINPVMLAMKENSCIFMLLVIFASFNAKGRLDWSKQILNLENVLGLQ